MISKLFRFRGHTSVLSVYRGGHVLRCKYWQLKWRTNERTPAYRASVVVSRKVTKNSPSRNRIRRRIYELVRHNASDLRHVDMVFIVYDAAAAAAPATELAQIVQKQLEELKKTR